MITDRNGVEVTEATWELVSAAIDGFVKKYPTIWLDFRKDLQENNTEYGLALEGDLKKASYRNTLAFPIAWRPRTEQEIKDDPANGPVEFGTSLRDVLDMIIPGFTDPDIGAEKGAKDIKRNKLYIEFIRRYGKWFSPASKY